MQPRGLIAIFSILIEIEKRLEHAKEVQSHEVYHSMEYAAPTIVKTIIDASRDGSSDPVSVEVIGARLSGIEVVVKQIYTALRKAGQRPIHVDVFFIDGFYELEPPIRPDSSKTQEMRERWKKQAKLQKGRIEEINDEWKSCTGGRIRFLPIPSSQPTFYAFIIDRKMSFFGHFQWYKDKGDWRRPDERCYRIDGGSQPFEMYEWLENRVNSYRDWFSAKEEEFPR